MQLGGGAACLVPLQHSLYQSGLLGTWPNGEFTGFLSLEMVWYIAISMLALVYLNERPNVLVCLALLILVFAQIACAFGHRVPMGRLSMLVCCVPGAVCYRRAQGDISERHFLVLFGLLTFIIALNLFVGFKLFPSAHPSASFKMAIDSWAVTAVIFFVPLFMRRTTLCEHPALSFLGRVSYSIYLLHGVILMLLIQLHGITLIVRVVVVTLVLSTLTYQFLELPPIRFGHSLKHVRRDLPAASMVVGETADRPC
jgi:peptidoglycan/LPS O-acetylase OafA/YrhL